MRELRFHWTESCAKQFHSYFHPLSAVILQQGGAQINIRR
nr:MAG TPA: hypothetical protein [Caudoviricetes sp.]